MYSNETMHMEDMIYYVLDTHSTDSKVDLFPCLPALAPMVLNILDRVDNRLTSKHNIYILSQIVIPQKMKNLQNM